MSTIASERIERFESPRLPDAGLTVVVIALVVVGLGALFSASYYRAENFFDDPFFFLRSQIVFASVGAGAAVLASIISLQFVRRMVPVVVLIALVFTSLTFVPGIGLELMGARRWILIFDYSFQPSELVKLALVLYLAYILSKKQDKLDDLSNSILPPFIVVLAFTALVYLQNDFSTSVFLLITAMLLFFAAGVRVRYFVSFAIMVLPLSLILLLTREHRVNRILAFLDPGLDPAGGGFQVLAAERALTNGGLWGRGIGRSAQKLGGLPEAHSDFVFAIIGEEVGFVGVLLVIGLFAAFGYRGFRVALRTQDRFKSLLAVGLTSSILYQAILNLAVVSGLVPATGIPLPFFSSGGSSAVITLAMCGLLINISRFAELGTGADD
jgi:cell division protein FtsW